MNTPATTELPVAKDNITGPQCMSCPGTVTIRSQTGPFFHLTNNLCCQCQDEGKLKNDLERREKDYRNFQRLPRGRPKRSKAQKAYDKARLAYVNFMFKKEKDDNDQGTSRPAQLGSKKRDRSLVSLLTSPTQQKKYRRIDELGNRVQKVVHFDESRHHRREDEIRHATMYSRSADYDWYRPGKYAAAEGDEHLDTSGLHQTFGDFYAGINVIDGILITSEENDAENVVDNDDDAIEVGVGESADLEDDEYKDPEYYDKLMIESYYEDDEEDESEEEENEEDETKEDREQFEGEEEEEGDTAIFVGCDELKTANQLDANQHLVLGLSRPRELPATGPDLEGPTMIEDIDETHQTLDYPATTASVFGDGWESMA